MNRGMCHSLFNSWQGVNKQIERLNILLSSHFIFSSIFNLCGMVAFYKCMEPPRQRFQVWLILSDKYNAQTLALVLTGLDSRKPQNAPKFSKSI